MITDVLGPVTYMVNVKGTELTETNTEGNWDYCVHPDDDVQNRDTVTVQSLGDLKSSEEPDRVLKRPSS